MTLLLAATRRVREGDQVVRSGRFGGWRPELYGLGLPGAQVGLVGFGAVGQAIARRLTGFGCQLVHTDPAATANHHQGSRRVGLGELVTSSDAIVISAPLLPETVGMVGATQLDLMPDQAILVNVGRGSVVDEQAVASALGKGRLGAYATDVFAFEDASLQDRPPTVPYDLIRQERTVFTPHLGSATTTARRSNTGVILGLPGTDYHLEFIHHAGGSPCPASTTDNLLVFYFDTQDNVDEVAVRLARVGAHAVEAENPFWSQHGGVTFEDPDWWRVVLMPAPVF